VSLTVITFHRVIGRESFDWPAYAELGLACTKSAFQAIVERCVLNYEPILLEDALGLPREKLDTQAYIALTFDDGFKEHAELSGVLQSLGIPSTFFIVTSVIDERDVVRPMDFYYYLRNACYFADLPLEVLEERVVERMHVRVGDGGANRAIRMHLRALRWEESGRDLESVAEALGISSNPSELNASLYCDRHDLASMVRCGMRLGAHTVTHRLLTSLCESQQEWEITRSLSQLGSITGRDEMPFCYPFGSDSSYSKLTVAIVERSHAICACTSVSGLNDSGLKPYGIKRVDASSGNLTI
jgi:peptidoglycan/xylan/chitin deacetylase (PgdA/CDA1 family)